MLVVVTVGHVLLGRLASCKPRGRPVARSSTGPTAGDGTNYLIVGSDSREGMSAEEKKKLHTGSAEGKRTDSMMILHVGEQRPHDDLAAA